MYKDRGYKRLYEKHHDCHHEDSCFYCTSTLCDKGKTNHHAVNYKERDLYQVENEEMSRMDININYDKLRDFYDEQHKIDRELKIDSFTTLIPLPLVENDLSGVYVYVTEIHTDFSTRTTPLTIQDPVWVNYDLDACQVRLDQPLLFDVTDIQQVHWCWKCIAALKNLSSIMCNYLNDKGEKSESHYFMDMRYLLTDLQRHYASKCDDDGSTLFINFITSALTICINQAFNSLGINNNNNVSKFDGCANIYIPNTAPFIKKFVYAEIRENSVLKKEVALRIIVDNILNKLLNNTQYMNVYRSMSCNTAKSLLPIMANIFELTDDTLAGYTYHEGVKTLKTNDLYKLFPIESCDTYINSKDFVESNFTDDIEPFSRHDSKIYIWLHKFLSTRYKGCHIRRSEYCIYSYYELVSS